ncbi:MAG: helix-turn-helix domain-containing protein [Alphaproteobacteria bacterium]|nr:helix-turn-helix domain-containing protein [Alphaproteobacteria bacterium]
MQSELLTVMEFCQAVNLGKTSVYKLINEGKISAVKLGKKTLIPRSVVHEFIASLPAYHAPDTKVNSGGRDHV